VDELSLDAETVATQAATVQRDPWLARRLHGWGASEVAALLLAYDPRDEEARTARRYHHDDAEHGRAGVPRLVARKAGLLAGRRQSSAMAVGSQRERELVARAEALIAIGPIAHADCAPREFYPLVDRECPVLTATPDGWCRGPSDELIAVEAKCTREHPGVVIPWYWRSQLQAQIACMSAEAGILVCGPGWVVGSNTSPMWWMLERNDDEIARIRRVAVRAWVDVERLRAARKAA
jgi:hypothetical protein